MGYLFYNFLYVITVVSGILGKPPSNNTTPDKAVSGFLGKFNQNDYKMIFERLDLVRSNPKFGEFHVQTFKFNRTTPATNGSFIFTMNPNYDTEVIAQVYRFASNEYRVFPLRLEFNLCEGLASNAAGLNKISKECGNLVCPLQKKGKRYYISNFTPDGSKFPPLIPNGKYMVELQFLYHSEEAFVVSLYAAIDRPIPYI